MKAEFNNEKDFLKFKVLRWNLKTKPFQVMATGEKKLEYRKIKKTTDSRLFNKDGSLRHYDYIRFQIAYQPQYPFFYSKYEGFEKVKDVHIKYSNGFEVNIENEVYAVKLGDIVFTGNLNHHLMSR